MCIMLEKLWKPDKTDKNIMIYVLKITLYQEQVESSYTDPSVHCTQPTERGCDHKLKD